MNSSSARDIRESFISRDIYPLLFLYLTGIIYRWMDIRTAEIASIRRIVASICFAPVSNGLSEVPRSFQSFFENLRVRPLDHAETTADRLKWKVTCGSVSLGIDISRSLTRGRSVN